MLVDAVEKIYKGLIKVEKVIFQKGNFCIFKFVEGEGSESYLQTEELKGIDSGLSSVLLKEGATYEVKYKLELNNRYGLQIKCIEGKKVYEPTSKDVHKKFFLRIFTELQVEAIFEGLEDPLSTFKNRDGKALLNVKGCGLKTANKWLDKFHGKYENMEIYVELCDYDLSDIVIRKLIKKYGGDRAVDIVKNSPYELCWDGTFTFNKADEIARAVIKGKTLDEMVNDVYRTKAFIKWYLKNKGEEGCSYVTEAELIEGMFNGLQIIDEDGGVHDVTEETMSSALVDMINNKVVWRGEGALEGMFGLMTYYDLEENIARQLLDLKNSKAEVVYDKDEWMVSIKRLELEQGWKFDEGQLKGIKTVLDNNVCVVTGIAGTGKSSVVSGVLRVLKKYKFEQCALAGRAAARLAEATGEKGKTIHSLIGMGANSSPTYNRDNPLDTDVVIVDEFSMIDGKLFKKLISAIPRGKKLILLGDPGQLDAIGCCSIANDIINSGAIPVVKLTTIHRQAENSGIITESKKVYEGEQLIPDKEYVTRDEVRGVNEDFFLTCYSPLQNTYAEVIERYKEELIDNDGTPRDIMDVQIICPIKDRGNACTAMFNEACQLYYHEVNGRDLEGVSEDDMLERGEIRGLKFDLFVGDKVINTANNYGTKEAYITPWGEWHESDSRIREIYNGNMGIVRKIDKVHNTCFIEFKGIGGVAVPFSFLSNIELGYATTVHKYQGSEAKYVIIALDYSHMILLSRELLYTAITRAKEKCILVAQNSALRYSVSHHAVSTKKTHLKRILYNMTNRDDVVLW